MKQEILLFALGDPSYGGYAFNLALSIKRWNPDLYIRLVYEDQAIENLSDFHKSFFNSLVPIKREDLYENGKFFPARAKTRMYDYIQADECLFLDVDAVALKDLQPLLNYCSNHESYYLTQIHRFWDISQGTESIPDMAWATAKTIWEHYKFSDNAVMPCTQSSFAYIKRCKQSEDFFKQLKENIDYNPIPLEKLAYKWGGSQPDELYLNVTMAQLGLLPKMDITPIYFHNFHLRYDQLDECYLLGLFGAKGMTSNTLIKQADRMMHDYCRNHYKINQQFKYQQLVNHKFANKTK